MLARQRQEVILDEVRTTGGVRVSELVERLGVSDMTIRRDIEALAERGLVTRVHGGATAAGSSVDEPGFAATSTLHTAAKQAIAAAAVQLLEPGASVALSAGTTTHAVAAAMIGIPRLTVVTNSLRVAEVLYESGGDDMIVVLTGGERTPSDALVGPLSVAALRRLHVDWLLMGVHGMDAEAGFTTPNLAEAETNRALVASARRVAVVADNSKWGVVGLSTIASLSEVDVVVSDGGLQPDARQVLESSCGREVLPDTRDLPHVSHGSTMRFDVLTGEWVAIAAHRQDRTYMPPADHCPLDPTLPGREPTEIPAPSYDVVVFENRFPSFAQSAPEVAPEVDGNSLWPQRPAVGRCEVVCFTSDHNASFGSLPVSRVR